MIKAKNHEWVTAASALVELAQRQPKNAAFAFRIRRMMRVILPAAEEIEKAQKKLVDDFTLRGPDNKPVMEGENRVRLTDGAEYARQSRELDDVIVSLHVDPLSAEDLEKEGIVPSGALAYRLGPLLRDPLESARDDGVSSEAVLAEPPAP